MERVRFASIHNLTRRYKISLNEIANPRSVGADCKSAQARIAAGKSRKTSHISIENDSLSQFSINHKPLISLQR